MTTTNEPKPEPGPRPRPARRPGRTAVAAAVVGAFAVGAGATALAQRARPSITFVALTPGPVSAMKDWAPVAVKGKVAEIFGNKFILEDDSGRALVETGPQGDDGTLVTKSEPVTIQGRFEHGFIHAIAIEHADGRTDVVAPPGPPRPGPMRPDAGLDRP